MSLRSSRTTRSARRLGAAALWDHLEKIKGLRNAEHQTAATDRDLIERHVERIVVNPNAIEVRLLDTKDEPTTTGDHQADCIGWMRETGFSDIRLEPLTTDQSMVVGIK